MMHDKYKDLNDNQKNTIIKKLYEVDNKSFQDIALLLDTYPNKIRRDAIKYKINIKNKSAAQKNALSSGKHSHPTKGTSRPETTKRKIGRGVLKSWDSLSEDELNSRKLTAKTNWDNLSIDDKAVMKQKANVAVRKSSKVGSKLEHFILEQLLASGYKVNFHQEHSLSNTRLQIDLLIPSLNVAIEVDGPSHFLPVWGEDALKKNISYDEKKAGLLLGKGLVLIRIKQTKDFSRSRGEKIYNELAPLLKDIENNFPSIDNRLLIIEDK